MKQPLDEYTRRFILNQLYDDSRRYGPAEIGGLGTSLSYMNQQYQQQVWAVSTIPATQSQIYELIKELWPYNITDAELSAGRQLREQAGLI